MPCTAIQYRALTAPPYLPTSSFKGMKQSLYTGAFKIRLKRLAQTCSVTIRYLDNVVSLNNSKISEFIDIIKRYCSPVHTLYGDCYIYIDNGKLASKLYDKRDDFHFPIVNFPFFSSNIPSVTQSAMLVPALSRHY